MIADIQLLKLFASRCGNRYLTLSNLVLPSSNVPVAFWQKEGKSVPVY